MPSSFASAVFIARLNLMVEFVFIVRHLLLKSSVIGVFLAIVTSGCAGDTPQLPMNEAELPAPDLEVPDGITFEAHRLSLDMGGVSLSIPQPHGWETYQTDFGIVLAEHIGSVATGGALDGVLVHIFAPPMHDIPVPIVDSSNAAWETLRRIIADPAFVGSASVSEPAPFIWSACDAAYYLLNNGDGNVSIVIGLMLPQTRTMITISASAPSAQSERMRTLLPLLLDSVTINGLVLDGDHLDALPDPLDFPHYTGDAQ